MKAIVIDDDAVVRSLLTSVMKGRGYEVLSYPNPQECPLYTDKGCPCSYDKACPDVIITDFDMPFVNGIELLWKLKDVGCKCTNMALISGTWSEAYLKQMAPPGVVSFAKPFELDHIEKWLDETESR